MTSRSSNQHNESTVGLVYRRSSVGSDGQGRLHSGPFRPKLSRVSCPNPLSAHLTDDSQIMTTQWKERLSYELDLLSQLHPSLGKVAVVDATAGVLTFDVSPCADLPLLGSGGARFTVTLPPNWPAKAPRVIYSHGPAPSSSAAAALPGTGSLVKCPLLDEDEGWSRTYTLCTLLHTLRDLFKAPGAPDTPWDAAATPWQWGPKAQPQSGMHFGFSVAHAGVQGRRPTMEDVGCVRQGLPLPAQYPTECGGALLGIFDGHAGPSCAAFAEARVAAAVLGQLKVGRSWREALSRGLVEVDGAWLAQPEARTGAGCTACVVAFDGRDGLFAANLGDCRAVIGCAGGCRDLTLDCRAERPDEVARIVARGGFVHGRRVNGSLAVSRALGDAEFKRPLALVTACPELTETRLQPSDEFLLVACDGLWDVMASAEACQFVRDRLRFEESKKDSEVVGGVGVPKGGGGIGLGKGGDREQRALERVALALARHAVDDRHSSDNVSVVLCRLVPPFMDGGRHVAAAADPARPPHVAAAPAAAPAAAAAVAAGSGGVGGPAAAAGLYRRQASRETVGAPAGVPTGGWRSNPEPVGSTNLLGLHVPGSPSPSPSPAVKSPAVVSPAPQPVMPRAKKDGGLESDKDLMEFLMDDANFG